MKNDQCFWFKEFNGWEGETWHYFIPCEGNETEWDKLKKFLTDNPHPECYECMESTLSLEKLSIADSICSRLDIGGYGAPISILSGKFIFKEFVPFSNKPEDKDLLYKGGICQMMHKEEELAK